MDKLLKDMKDDFENYLNEERVFTGHERRRVINQVNYSSTENKRQNFFPKVLSSVTLVSLCVLIVFLVLTFTNAGEKSQPADLHNEINTIQKDPIEQENPVKTLPKYSDKEIADKVNVLQNQIVLGMTEKEVLALLGNEYVEFDDSESKRGAVKQIGYNFLVSDSTDQLNISKETAVESIQNREIGVQFYVGFSNRDEVLFTTINFAEGDSVLIMSKGKNGRVIETISSTSNSDVIKFTLTPEETVIYQKFLQDLDEKHLKDLNPVSIAKLYVQAQIDKRYDAEYALYTDREEFVHWTKEEHDSIPESDQGTTLQTLTTYNHLEAGRFIQDGEYDGYIEYEASKNADAKSGFKMIKDEDGIWNVSFMPIQ
ncbi:hypothetical protein [Fictibacillus phosphorivorans]|uniref:hypothetical protein n=1 Tax=Fictibacillus phosphorivorans TaxID=1221500 RepID=UPI00203BCF66|nr:hypothetical protein [Fictibacillus phosphorivorans]MCM3717548.1 hypothetical protein [Fictibacillus phosphorivorans]MCM3775243.1 hypothetical protein [Fictibacillus phosphorivorans]